MAGGDTVAAPFVPCGTHLDGWRGHPPTGRLARVDEVSSFRLTGGRLPGAWGIEDSRRRLRRLGLLGADAA